jgi:hypothetical protein
MGSINDPALSGRRGGGAVKKGSCTFARAQLTASSLRQKILPMEKCQSQEWPPKQWPLHFLGFTRPDLAASYVRIDCDVSLNCCRCEFDDFVSDRQQWTIADGNAMVASQQLMQRRHPRSDEDSDPVCHGTAVARHVSGVAITVASAISTL